MPSLRLAILCLALFCPTLAAATIQGADEGALQRQFEALDASLYEGAYRLARSARAPLRPCKKAARCG